MLSNLALNNYLMIEEKNLGYIKFIIFFTLITLSKKRSCKYPNGWLSEIDSLAALLELVITGTKGVKAKKSSKNVPFKYRSAISARSRIGRSFSSDLYSMKKFRAISIKKQNSVKESTMMLKQCDDFPPHSESI